MKLFPQKENEDEKKKTFLDKFLFVIFNLSKKDLLNTNAVKTR